jgi:hypothetical protein
VPASSRRLVAPLSWYLLRTKDYAIRATYSRAALIKRLTTQCEHEIVGLSVAAASTSQARACACGAAGPKQCQGGSAEATGMTPAVHYPEGAFVGAAVAVLRAACPQSTQ